MSLEAAGEISEEALWAARARNPEAISSWVNQRLAEDDVETAELVLSCAIEIHPDDGVRQRLMDQVHNTQPGNVDEGISTRLLRRPLRLAYRVQSFTGTSDSRGVTRVRDPR